MLNNIKHFTTHLLVFLILLSSFPYTTTGTVFAAETTVTTQKISFLASQKFNSSSSLSGIDVGITAPEGYVAKSYVLWMMTANSAGSLTLNAKRSATLTGNEGSKLTLDNVPGTKIKVTATGHLSDMYYVVNRRSNGTEWIVGRSSNGGGTYYVTPPKSTTACWSGSLSICPGELPEKDNTGKTIDSLVRNTAKAVDGTSALNYAIEESDGFAGPIYYEHALKSDIYKSAVIPSSIEVTSAVPFGNNVNHKVLKYGKGSDGYGYLKVGVNLASTLQSTSSSCTGCTGNAIALKYTMQTQTSWAAETYYYEGEVRVTYEKLPSNDKPTVDCSCKVDPSSVQFANQDIEVNSTLTASVKQKGTLKVKDWKIYGRAGDGSQLQSQTLGSGSDSISYKFKFTISKDKLASVGSYTETFVMRAIVTFTDGTTAEQVIECTTTVTKPGATPAPSPTAPGATPTPTPEPTATPRPVLEISADWTPTVIYTGESATLTAKGRNFSAYSWEFSNNLDPLITDNTDYGHGPIRFDEPGVYKATITASNEFEAKSDTAILYVNDPKPVAIVTGVTRWVQGRPFPSLHHLLNSYTPLSDKGVTIDFSKSEIRYKKIDASTFINGSWPEIAPMELGQYSLEGKVYDSQGRISEWGNLILDIVPDEPPIVEIYSPEEGIRNNNINIIISASSPDGDTIETMKLEERYDADNDGDFDEEGWKVLYEGPYKESFMAKYTTVGKREYRATVSEDYGLSGVSNITQTDIINIAPVVDFTANGITQQPDPEDEVGPPVKTYLPESILRSWTLKKPYVGGNEGKAGWYVDGNKLITRNSEWADFEGSYNLANNLEQQTGWTYPANESVYKKILPGYKVITYNSSTGDYYVRNMDTGEVLETYNLPTSLGTLQAYHEDGDKVYLLKNNKSEGVYGLLRLYKLTGELVAEYPAIHPALGVNDSVTIQTTYSKDKKTAYFLETVYTSQSDPYASRRNLYITKYSMTQKTVLWRTPLFLSPSIPVAFELKDIQIADDGTIYIPYAHTYYLLEDNIYYNDFDIISDNGTALAKNRLSMGRISGAAISNDDRYVYMSALRMVASPYGTNRERGVYIYDSVNKTLNFTLFQSNTVASSPTLRLDMAIFNPTVNPIDGTVYAPLLFLSESGFISKDGTLISKSTTVETNLKNKLNQYMGSNDSSVSMRSNTMQPFFQPSGKLTWNMYGEKWTKNVPTTYYPYTGFATLIPSTGAIETSLEFDSNASTYYQYTATTGDPISAYQGIYDQRASKVAPDGSILMFANKRYYNETTKKWKDLEYYVLPFKGESTGEFPKLIDDHTVAVDSATWGGLFYDPIEIMRNQVLEFNVTVNDMKNDKTIGAAIHIQDEKNMYSVEWTKNELTLYKVQSGQKTSLKQASFARSAGIPYAIKIEGFAGTIRVSINGSKKLEATDSTFVKGSAGIISLGQQQASFNQVTRTNYGNTIPEETYQAVLVGEQIKHDKLFADTELDAKFAEEWSYTHDANYFANSLGLSQYDGQNFSSALASLDKPGAYEITYRAQDNPNFASYRLFSEPITKNLFVHRRPVALPDVAFTGIVYPEGEALDYLTNDKSYDPDIPDRLADRLFRTRWADEAAWTTGQRLLYNRPGVELIIQEQVKDYHGAWSYWEEDRVYKAALPPVNQTKPRMIITVPSGTAANPSVYISVPTIQWTYKDDENNPQELYRLYLTYIDTGKSALQLQGIGDDVEYELPAGSIEPGRTVQVQGQVYSEGSWSDYSNKVYFMLNRQPTTTLLTFNGEKASSPVYTNNNRPELRVAVVDPDNHSTRYIDYEVFYNATGTQVVDTNTLTAATAYTPGSALQEGLHNWRARAHDSYVWGAFSTNGYFFVDTVRPDDVNEQLKIEPTAVEVTFNAFSDAAPSSGHATRSFYMQQVNANGSVTNIDLDKDGAAEYSVPIANTKKSYRVDGLKAGQQYRLTVIDYDVAGNQGQYAYIYFVTNRPPSVELDWQPKPVFEGDTVTFMAKADDSDLDTLDVTMEITDPQGSKKSYSYTVSAPYSSVGPKLRMEQSGQWTVTVEVSDRIADTVAVTKTVQVLPLSLAGYVKHTEQWNQNRIDYNLKAGGDENSPRGYSMFWAGEKFMLEAITTVTGTSTSAERVEAAMGAFSVNLKLATGSAGRWTGELWDESFAAMKTGPIVFTFTSYYNNGIVKKAAVTVQIEGSTLQVVGVHRVW